MQELNGTLAELSAIHDSGVYKSTSLEDDINATMESASYSSSDLKRLVVGSLGNINERFGPIVQKADSYR
jgi:hypothetical protein